MGLIAVEQQQNTHPPLHPTTTNTHAHSLICKKSKIRPANYANRQLFNHGDMFTEGVDVFPFALSQAAGLCVRCEMSAPEGKRTVPSSILPNPLPLDREEDKYCCRCLTLCKWDFSSQIYQALAGCLRLQNLALGMIKWQHMFLYHPPQLLLPKGYDHIVNCFFPIVHRSLWDFPLSVDWKWSNFECLS